MHSATVKDSSIPSRRWRWRRLLWSLLLLVVALAVSAWWVLRLPAFGALHDAGYRTRMQASAQWRDGQFHDPQPQWLDLRGALREAVFAAANPDATPQVPPSVAALDPDALKTAPASGLRVTWFGHSSTLLEIDGIRVLLDPFWGQRASPFSWMGPQRWYPPPIALQRLPPIDAVLISHDHYDHLDQATIETMRDWPTLFVVPLGIGAHLQRWGIPANRIRELDWWQSTAIHGVTLTATPARHASGRRSSASNQTLWAGWALHGAHHRAWFSGDTGLHDDLARIGQTLGPFDITLIEIGQYDPHWPDNHLGPEQAMVAHRMVRGGRMIPVHWGLLQLAPHTWTEPVERVLGQAQCSRSDVLVLQPGQPTEPATTQSAASWWPQLAWRKAVDNPIASTRSGNPAQRYPDSDCAAATTGVQAASHQAALDRFLEQRMDQHTNTVRPERRRAAP